MKKEINGVYVEYAPIEGMRFFGYLISEGKLVGKYWRDCDQCKYGMYCNAGADENYYAYYSYKWCDEPLLIEVGRAEDAIYGTNGNIIGCRK